MDTPVVVALELAQESEGFHRSVSEIAGIPWHSVPERPGLHEKLLWHDPLTGSTASVLRIDRGRVLVAHSHPHTGLHVWVLEGRCSFDGTMLCSDSYTFVPAGVVHEWSADAQDGCTLFVVYASEPSATHHGA